MAFMNAITRYKDNLLQLAWQNEAIKSLILPDNTTFINFEKFREHVFPYYKNAEAITQAGTLIYFDVDAAQVASPTILDFTLSIWIYVSGDIFETPDGMRCDLIAKEFDKMLSGNRNFGIGPLEIQEVAALSTTAGLCGRKLNYLSKDFNRRR